MTDRLSPYGLSDYAGMISKVGKTKAVRRLAERMPSPEIMAKVGQSGDRNSQADLTHRVVRRNALKLPQT